MFRLIVDQGNWKVSSQKWFLVNNLPFRYRTERQLIQLLPAEVQGVSLKPHKSPFLGKKLN